MARFVSLLALLLLAPPAPAEDDIVGRPFWVTTPPAAQAALVAATRHVTHQDWDRAAGSLQLVFDRYSFAFTAAERGRYEGARHRALRLLASLPGAGREAYEARSGSAAEKLLREALAADNRPGLLEVIRRYEGTKAGLGATVALADRALLRARPAEARLLLARLRALHPEAAQLPDVKRRIALATARDRAEGGPPPTAWEEATHPPELPELQHAAWPMLGGDATRTGTVEGVVVHDPPSYSIDIDIGERMWDRPPRPSYNYRYGAERRDRLDWEGRWKEYDPVHPVIARGVLVYGDGAQVHASNLYTGEPMWTFPERSDLENEGRTNLSSLFSPAVADGVVYATVEVSVAHRAQQLQGVPITYYLARRRLVALDLATGEVLWKHDDQWLRDHPEGGILGELSVTGPPLVRGNQIYVGASRSKGTFQTYVVAVDRRTGELTYATRISNGQQELNLFGRQLQECAGTPIAEAEGVLYFGTNLGVVTAVDALLGTPLWAMSYDIIPIPSTFYWFEAPRRWPRFDNGPPLVVGDRLLIAPADGEDVLSLDRRTGRIVWKAHHKGFADTRSFRLRVLQGADDERVYLSGRSEVTALWLIDDAVRGAVPGGIAWQCPLEDDIDGTRRSRFGAGRGLLADNGLWIPTYDTIYRVDPRSGKTLNVYRRTGPDTSMPVNLVWGDGVLVAAAREGIVGRYDENTVLALAKRRIAASPDAVGPLLGAADVYLATGRLSQAIEYYRRAQVKADALGVPAASARARNGLHRALLRRAQQALERGDSDAGREYEAAFRAAPDDRTRLRARLELDRLLADTEPEGFADWRLRNLRAIARDHGEESLDATGRSVRAWALREMADLLANGRRVKAAFEVLHELLELDADGEDGRYASRRIRMLLEANGRRDYEPYEKRAARLFEAALRSGDLEALERGLRIYSNAEAAETATLELARRRLEAGEPAAAARVLQQYLVDHNGSPRVPEALALMVRALHERKSYGPAYAGLLRLKSRFGDELVTRADGARIAARAFVDEWLARDPYPELARSAQRRDLDPRIVLRFERGFPDEDFLDVPDLLGPRPEALRDALLVRAHRSVIALDARDGHERYRLEFARGEPKGPLVFAGQRLHAVTDQYIHVFDASSGLALYERPLPLNGRAERLLEQQGQVFLLFRQRSLRGQVGLAALHPDDGSVLWSRVFDEGGLDPRMATFQAVALPDRLLLFATHPVTVTSIDPTSGAVENSIVLDRDRGTRIAVEPIVLADGRVLVGLGTAQPLPRFEWKHSYTLALVDPASPTAIWKEEAPRDGKSRYLHMLSVVGKHVVALDDGLGGAVYELESGRLLKWEPALPLSDAPDDRPFLDHPQPQGESLLVVLTRSKEMGDQPARVTGFELPDLRRKYILPLTDGGAETASLVPTEGVLAIKVWSRQRRTPQPRIRLVDPLRGRVLRDILPPARGVEWINAKVQGGILVVTTSANVVYAYGPATK